MNKSREYNVYLAGMSKGNEEKLFFLEHLDLSEFGTIIDFGCGGGDILAALDKINIDRKFNLVGIDLDSYMRCMTKCRVPSCQMYASLEDYLANNIINEKTCIIFSSVLHEVGDFWPVIKKAISGTGVTIVIRDMCFSDTAEFISKDDLAKLVKNASSRYLSEFIAKYGMLTVKNLTHYLLKYSYVDNWPLELEEDYFSFNYDDLYRILSSIKYENKYTLEFKKKRVKEDFDIDLKWKTHIQLIAKC